MREKDVYTLDSGNLQTWMANLEGKLTHQDQNEELGKVVGNLEGSLMSRYGSLEVEMRKIEQALSNLQIAAEERVQKMVDAVFSATEKVKTEIIQSQTTDSAEHIRAIEKHGNTLITGQREIQSAVDHTAALTDKFYSALSVSYSRLSEEISSLPKIEKILLQTADNVMDTKRRVEYGVHQVLIEVGELVKGLGEDLNGTVNTRFSDISSKILDNQNEGLTNLSSKVETEISQVWRQIGIMYQQLSASAGTLDSLQKQTESYVNGSLSTMDGMENKVSMITGRMNEVDENLNYLLGRLSLTTQEFNLTKNALAIALDNIRSSFKEVKDKVNPNTGPGPNKIASDESVDNNNV